MPEPIRASTLTVQATPIATPFSRSNQNNLAAPKVLDGRLHFIDQRNGQVIVQTKTGFQTVLDLSDAGQQPAGYTPDDRVAILDVAEGPGGTVIVATTTTTLPDAAPAAALLPDTPDYTVNAAENAFQVIYKYERTADGSLTNPVALASLETGIDHSGGALLGLPNGDVLFATGDNLPFGSDGRAAPQDPASHVGSLLKIDGTSGAVQIVGKGVRNVQRMTWADAGQTIVAFSDIGGVVAEEINTVPLADLLDPAEIENFGWGRNADGNAREGTFYIDEGNFFVSGVPLAIAEAPEGEAGFWQPYAQWGRESESRAAITGPVFSPISLDNIDALFGDLGSGRLLATMTPPGNGAAKVFSVQVVDEDGEATTLLDLAGTARVDARFFNLPDMSAAVLLERAGTAYRLTEVTSIPVPAGIGGFAAALLWLVGRRKFASL